VAQQHLARGGQAQPLRLAVDQARPDVALEPGDLLRDGGLGVGERGGGGGEGSAQSDLPEDPQQADVVHNAKL
jgi:hypothetical protein